MDARYGRYGQRVFGRAAFMARRDAGPGKGARRERPGMG